MGVPRRAGPPGRDFAIKIAWRQTEPIADGLFVTLQLTDASGRRWSQSDAATVDAEGLPTSGWSMAQSAAAVSGFRLTVPADAPPGAHAVEAAVYSIDGGEARRLTVAVMQGTAVRAPMPVSDNRAGLASMLSVRNSDTLAVPLQVAPITADGTDRRGG